MKRLACLVLCAAFAPLLRAGAFEFRWTSARAAGMGGACIAATDPSAIACNPGALALAVKPKGAAVGMAATKFKESLFQGLAPGIAAASVSQQKTPMSVIPHIYATLPLAPNIVMGTGIYYPYKMHTEWTPANAFSGRFLSNKSDLDAYDLTTTISTKVGDTFGMGAGVVYQSSRISASRRLALASGSGLKEIASLDMKTDTKRSIGWTAGFLWQPGDAFSAGASYQGSIDTTYNGVGKLTQIATGDAQFDQLVKASFPFNQDLPVSSHMDFPSQLTFGAAISTSKALMFAIEASRTGWSKTSAVDFQFLSNRALDTHYNLAFEDSWTYRGGVRYRFPTGPQIRFGYALDKSPQPDVSVGPFLPDADRTTLTTGFGLDWLDVAFGWTTYKQRIIRTNADQFNGNYRAGSWIAMLTVTK